ncbi:hypothetical protein JMJ35_004196 [Cladonia borealis]|uniref:Uncharacterized protein n=1 Tax=Cladonia borealis TaxID=184061 RepID=A0AA39V8N7_9LECA|nr:hypothetical protein JMJ35_004196 [Cladonia borealis]
MRVVTSKRGVMHFVPEANYNAHKAKVSKKNRYAYTPSNYESTEHEQPSNEHEQPAPEDEQPPPEDELPAPEDEQPAPEPKQPATSSSKPGVHKVPSPAQNKLTNENLEEQNEVVEQEQT